MAADTDRDTDTDRMRLVIIVGSVRQGRFGLVAAEWLASQARLRDDFDIDVIDLDAVWLPDVMFADPAASKPQAVQDLAPWLAAADAFVVVTPEYKQSFPASLKSAVDWYDEEWHAKPVAFLSYGGASSGLCAVAQLRPIFAEAHAVTVRETVSFHVHHDQEHLDPHGRLDPAGCPLCTGHEAARAMLDRLGWWARALRRAREAEPYERATNLCLGE
ncbi:FMN reductase [Streptomyces ruber]|uniref:FMN reductase n=3 Tax=Streptomyces TaxID=1883 RepID=A0A918BDL8_9ACTN|nr:FMN reductase [Streptomyces ruber]